jgi:NAD(P)-dependent dehydrogenase (short-subunit alcohol dehydrogenase family)
VSNVLEGKRALVVGGSGGIGAAVVAKLAAFGCNVAVHGGHSRERLDATCSAATRRGVEAVPILMELTSVDQVAELLERTGDFQILVGSFGPLVTGSIHATSPEDLRAVIELNLHLPARLLTHVLPRFRAEGFGRVLFFGGPRTDQIRAYRDIGVYAAAKTGLASLVRSAGLQNADRDITCNMICPGYVETEYYDRERVRALARVHPAGRLVSTNEVAALAVHLLSGEGAAINGAIIPIDFGERRGKIKEMEV